MHVYAVFFSYASHLEPKGRRVQAQQEAKLEVAITTITMVKTIINMLPPSVTELTDLQITGIMPLRTE